MKRVGIFITLAIVLGIVVGIYLYKTEESKVEKVLIGALTNSTTEIINEKEEISTSSSETKIGPNTEIIKQEYYKVCGHIKEIKIENNDYINMTKEEFTRLNPQLKIKTFNEDKVIVVKEINEFCKEHYLLKDDNGYISIYYLNHNNTEAKLIEKTEILTKYLSEQDKKQLSQGIKVYSKTDLNKLIEDFE